MERVGVIRVVPADGVTFVDPDGYLIAVTPASGTLGYESASEYGRRLARTLRDEGGAHVGVLSSSVGTRTFSWRAGEGRLIVRDTSREGDASERVLRSGDVVPLLPGTLEDQPLTPDKAVTIDLASGDYPVWIYPQRNEVYVASRPWIYRERPVVIPVAVARRYGLSASDGGYSVRTGFSGGSWSYRVDDARMRTVSWRRGETYVKVTDRASDGGRILGTEHVSIGRRVDAG